MKFTYFKRGVNGVEIPVVVEAESRDALLKRLKAENVRAIRVVEGEVRQPKPHRVSGFALAMAAVVAAGVIALLVWLLRDARPEPRPAPKPEQPAAESPVTTPAARPVAVREQEPAQAADPEPQPAKETARQPRKRLKIVDLPPEVQEEIAKMNKDTTLRTIAENRLALLASIKPGMPVPPMPDVPGLEKSFEEAEKNVIQALPDDTEHDLETKVFVAEFKEKIREGKAQGKTAVEVLHEYEADMNRVAAYRRETLLAAREMQRNGEDAQARELVREVNAELEEMGAMPIDLDNRPKKRQ